MIDDSNPHSLAVLRAIASRPSELRRLTDDLRCMKNEMITDIYESSIKQLNEGWRQGKPPEILLGYINTIMNSAGDSAIDEIAKLRGRSAVSVVKYALGDLIAGYELSKSNWRQACRLESDEESELKFIAAYGHMNSTLFLGEFKKAMQLMADQWNRYYSPLDELAKESLRQRLTGHLILNPILAIPRHMILAAAFNERPILEAKYWPSEATYNKLSSEDRECQIQWAHAWYEEAKRICTSEATSLSFTHAYLGFYFTLLLLEPGMPQAYLHNRIKQAFDAIDDSTIVAQYVKYGFTGIYHLVCGEDEKALASLCKAARLSAISGNRFADALFMCSHAVAAARLNRADRYLRPDIDHYLSEAEELARQIKRPFYKKLCHGARSAVCYLDGEKGKAQRYAARSKQGGSGYRILRIFYRDGQEPCSSE